MYKCLCGFKSTYQGTMKSHLIGCTYAKAKARSVDPSWGSDDIADYLLTKAVVEYSSYSDTGYSSYSDSGSSCSDGGGSFDGGGSSDSY